jgi:hypothetical protein
MGEDQPTMHTEDVELDPTDAEAVVGGIAVKHITMERAIKEGYEQIASMRNGALMKNMKTGKEIIVPDR